MNSGLDNAFNTGILFDLDEKGKISLLQITKAKLINQYVITYIIHFFL